MASFPSPRSHSVELRNRVSHSRQSSRRSLSIFIEAPSVGNKPFMFQLFIYTIKRLAVSRVAKCIDTHLQRWCRVVYKHYKPHIEIGSE